MRAFSTALRIVADLGEALADCVLVAGTSARAGGLFRKQTVGPPEAIMPSLVELMKVDHPVALVFGPEPSGLSNEMTTRLPSPDSDSRGPRVSGS